MAALSHGVFHGREHESPEAKARWFQSLPLAERMDYLCAMTDLILENNPRAAELKNDWVENAQPVAGRIRVLRRPRL